MKTLITISVLICPLLALFRSSSYSYSYGSPYYSSSNYYYSSNYYTTPYRSSSRYSTNDYKSYTYMDGSSNPTVSKADIERGVASVAKSNVIQSTSSFTSGKLRYYFGSQYMPSQDCGGDSSTHSRKKRAASATTTTTAKTTTTVRGASTTAVPTTSYSNYTVYNQTSGDNGNFSDYKDTLAYMNMFYVNFSDPAESLNYVETYLPDNFTHSANGSSSSVMKEAVANLPINTTRYIDLASSMMDSNGNINSSVSDWFNDMKDEQTYNDLISGTSGSGPIQTSVGCSKNAAYAVCTRSVSDLDSIYDYIYNPASPSEIAWQCPNKGQYCCEWECCQEKKMSTAGIIFTLIFFLFALGCCCALCCLCVKGKEKEKETLVVMYPKPQPQAYFISVPPRVYY